MKIDVIAYTHNPVDVISLAAGTSYGKKDKKASRVEDCIRKGHDSVLEHAVVTFRIEGISRTCANQLVRHRLASFVQESQRYTRLDVSKGDWFVTPPCYANDPAFRNEIEHAGWNYINALANGVKPEDARYYLPEATKTTVTMTMNWRELYHFFDLRLDKRAQWEIREMANAMFDTLAEFAEDQQVIDMAWYYEGIRK